MMKNILITIIALSVFAGCAKNRDRESLRDGNDAVVDALAKTSFLAPNEDGTRGVWMAKMTVVNTSDSPAGHTFVGNQGNLQVGYFDFTQYHMQFRSLKGMYDGVPNEANKNPVLLNWNIDHIDYALNEVDGQTTNKEIVSDFKKWNEKRYFKIQWSDSKEIANSNQLFPIISLSTFSCWNPVNIRRVGNSMKVEADAINFDVEVVYQRTPACGNSPQWAEEDFNFTVTYKYSFLKMKPSDYKPYFYKNEQDPDRYEYGHFQTVKKTMNAEGRPHNVFMENRWKEKTHYYYFSKGFPQKYKWIWDHTKPQSVFGQTNALMKSMGSNLRFEVYDYNYNHDTKKNDGPQREFGDLRYSFVNFVDRIDVGGSPLGYGPTDANPFTGEILSGTVNVWTSSLEFYLKIIEDAVASVQEESSLFSQMNRSLHVSAGDKQTIEDLVSDWDQSKGVGKLFRHMAQENRFGYPYWNSYAKGQAGEIVVPTQVDYYNKTSGETAPKAGDAAGYFSQIIELPIKKSDFRFETLFLNGRPQAQVINPYSAINLDWMKRLLQQPGALANAPGLRAAAQVLENLQVSGDHNDSDQIGLTALADKHFKSMMNEIKANQQGHCRLDMEEFIGSFAHYLKVGNIDLSDQQTRQDVINTILYRVSIHEFGHNLNLRHNFYGSVDKENFGVGKTESITSFPGSNGLMKFTINAKGEYVEQGLSRKQVSSSIMDYLRLEDELNSPWVFEDYDVAALRDSYAPKGFDAQGRLYLYCTDEHTLTSAICNRFDFGTTPSQILMSQIRSYDERYEMRNHRYGRAYWNTSGYAGAMLQTMVSFKEFIPFWRAGLAEDMLRNKLSDLGVSNNNLQTAQVEAIDREMVNVMKMSMAFFDGVVQQSRGTRDYRSEYDEVTGALKYMGIMSDKIFAMLVLAGDDAIFYNPNRVMLENSYLTYSGDPKLAQYADRLWRNILTDRNIAMEPWFINFSRSLYAKNATNFSNRGAANLINSMKIIKINNAEDLMNDYGIVMSPSLPTLKTRLKKAITGTYNVGEEVVVIHIDGSYYMTSIAEGDVTYTLFQGALDALTGAGSSDDESITQLNMDVREFYWLYNAAASGSLQ